MSQKQKEHNDNYHLEDLNETKSIESEVKDDIFVDTIWEELSGFRKTLSIYDPEIIKSYVKKNLGDEVIDIRKKFNEEFKNYPKGSVFKREVMILLGELGITIYHQPKEDVKDDLNYLG